MRNVDAPVMSSPCRIACWTGAAPRQAGSSEKCRLIQPCGGTSSAAGGSSAPYATTGQRLDAELAQPVEELRVARLGRASTPARRPRAASSATGEAVSRRPRPARAGGRVMTATTSCAGDSSRARSDGTAASGVPAKSQPHLVRDSTSGRARRGRTTRPRGSPASPPCGSRRRAGRGTARRRGGRSRAGCSGPAAPCPRPSPGRRTCSARARRRSRGGGSRRSAPGSTGSPRRRPASPRPGSAAPG